MDRNDWHPVDEKPLKPEFIKELQKAGKSKKYIRIKKIEDLFK